MSRYLVFDEETSIYQSHKRKANPFDPRNWIVMRGWKFQGDKQNSWEYFPEFNKTSYLRIPEDVTLLVGQNIKFDLLYEMCHNNPDLIDFFKRGGKIWCTQYAEYLIEGHVQEVQMASMDGMVEKYGGRLKLDEVKILWDQGVQTADIPEDLLTDYLVGTEEELRNSGDIGNTELIFLGQLKTAVAQGQIKMIQDRMDGLLCTTEMEYNGIKIDVAEAGRRLQVLKDRLAKAEVKLNAYVDNLPWTFSWGSVIQKSALIFGGVVRYEVRDTYPVPDWQGPVHGDWQAPLARLRAVETQYVLSDGRTTSIAPDSPNGLVVANRIGYATFAGGKRKGDYKTKQVSVDGELKTKLQDRFWKFDGYTEPREDWKGKATDAAGNPTYSTDKDTMAVLFNRDVPFLKALASKNKLDKEIGTYYLKVDPKTGEKTGMLTCVQPWDHMLHHSLNHTSTITSRLSANNPNMQNIPRNDEIENDEGEKEQKSEVKAMFVSRFGADGVMVEADYSQLEVVVQGVLSGDAQLCEDLRAKIDFHCKRVAATFGVTYEEAKFWCKNEDYADHALWKKRRTKAKNFSFQRAYGAGAQAIADATGMTKEEVEKLIEVEEAMYPGVVVFNARVEQLVTASSVPFQAVNEDTGEWQTYRRGEWWGPTRTRYRWRTHNAPAFMAKRGTKDTYSPPELKNYPVQGTGGEFVQAILGLLWRHFVSNDNYGGKAFLINTVHDCIWVDCHRDVYDQVCRDVKRIMESIPEFYNKRYGMNINVPFPVEVESGPNMINMSHFHEGEPAWHHKQAA